ncbi:nitroreductase family protein [Chitinophagaceae bacterium MMS25-I14]
MSLIQAMNWRYATKRMNGQKVPQEKVNNILAATRLSASSMGLQPYTILVIENEELRRKIQQVAFNQPQIVEGSHLLIFTAWEKITPGDVDNYINNIAATRGVPAENLNEFRDKILANTQHKSAEELYQWNARQAYIAFGTAIAAAAAEQVDATPMEGFNAAALDELLGLKEKGLRSVTLLPLGYRDIEKDFLANAAKVRRPHEELFISLS